MFVKLWKLFKKAGYAPYLAAVPIYNSVILLRIIGRPSWWVILLYFPIINLLMLPVVWVETARKFGKDSMTDSFLAWATLGLYGFYLNYASDVTYNPEQSVASKTKFGQFVGSIVYAVVIATVVHTYFMQPYIIPTGSLEKTLLVGDFLLVSKFHYGARAPQTVVSFPMVHDTIPLVRTRSYLKKPQLPYMRLPGLQQIKRNDIVVFSWPADTVRQFFKKEAGVVKPIDKKSNYVKRCVAIPGDTLTIEDGIIHINGKESNMPDRAKPIFGFKAYNAKGISARRLINAGYDDLTRKFLITNISQPILDALRPNLLMIANPDPSNYQVLTGSKGLPLNIVQQYRIQAKELLETQKNLFLTLKEAEELPNVLKLDSLKRNINTTRTYNDAYFPNNVRYNWNEDQFGPLVMPEKGVTVQLNPKNVALYKKIISDYELNDLEVSGDDIKINGATADTYTFKQNYYWMMGDNRHRSEDSRYWGFVPEDHIVGKPVFIWMSIDGFMDGLRNWKIRWERVFTTVGGSGKPVSYRWYFAVFVVIWQGVVWYRRRSKKA
ncbi:MAG: signal peptidase I [Flavobacteriaceae bacterium]|nr:signal peptidase I [Flavobacteriaceae bacterium]MDG2290427.1 signal peptidase I [Flavobacteriaceae bacterium]